MEYEHVHRKWRSEDVESKWRAKGRFETKDFVQRNKLEAGLGIRGRIMQRNDQVDRGHARVYMRVLTRDTERETSGDFASFPQRLKIDDSVDED